MGQHRDRVLRSFLEWVWASRFTLTAADNFALERLPVVPSSSFRGTAPNDRGVTHHKMLATLSLPIRELLRLAIFEAYPRFVQRWTALVTTQPLKLTGGIGLPVNAVAVCRHVGAEVGLPKGKDAPRPSWCRPAYIIVVGRKVS